jgi:hypothetical protein
MALIAVALLLSNGHILAQSPQDEDANNFQFNQGGPVTGNQVVLEPSNEATTSLGTFSLGDISAAATVSGKVCTNNPLKTTVSTFVPPVPARADIMFVFDTTASMQSVLDRAATEAQQILNNLSAAIPLLRFGVADFRDYPIGTLGKPGDYPFKLQQSLTDDKTAVEASLNNLSLGDGYDAPEAYSRAMYESYTNSQIGWGDEAKHFVVMFGDNFPRDNNLNEGIPTGEQIESGTYCGRQECKLDPGPDGQQGTADDLDLQEVLAKMKANQKVLLFGVSDGRSDTTPAERLPYWQHWTGITGGTAVQLNEADELTSIILNLVDTASRNIGELTLEARPTSYQSWLTFAPKQNIVISGDGQTFDFDVTITPPAGTRPGTYSFIIRTIGDGIVYGASTKVTVEVVDCLTPVADNNPLGTEHTVTALALNSKGEPMANTAVTFNITSGPNAGKTQTVTTGANGQATFTYTGSSGGTDVIQATYTNDLGQTITLEASKVWSPIVFDSINPIVSPGPSCSCQATIYDNTGALLVSKEVTYTIDGPGGPTSGTTTTNASGKVDISYSCETEGSYTCSIQSGGDTNTSEIDVSLPTAITLLSFTASSTDDHVTLAWETASELDNEGFNLWRSSSADGEFVKINSEMIQAQGNETTGASYSFVDSGVTSVTYYYKLEDVDFYGVSTLHSPVELVYIQAVQERQNKIFLPIIIR